MPYTTRQISRIIGDGATRVIPRNAPLNLSQRVSESEVRRRVYSYEDAAARDVLNLFKAAYADIRNYSNALAEYGDIRTLSTTSGASSEWRRRITFYAQERITTLLNDCANLTLMRVATAFHAGYLGRAWSIDVSTKPDVRVSYAAKDERVIRDLFAQDWQKHTGTAFYEAFDNLRADYAVKFKKAANNAVLNGERVMDANARFQKLLGLNRMAGKLVLGELYFYAQSNVRMAMMTAANGGALRLYAENARLQEAAGIGIAAIFLTAGDNKVCNICRPYAGRIFRLDSLLGAALSLAVEPPLHYGCRCGMVAVIAPEDLLPDDMPPGMTWIEWLILNGITELNEFMGSPMEAGDFSYDDTTYS